MDNYWVLTATHFFHTDAGDPDVLLKVPGRADVRHLERSEALEHLQLLNLT